MKLEENGSNFVLRVPRTFKRDIPALMAYRGLTFSTSASSKESAVLWSNNPYSVADLADEDTPSLASYKSYIDLSRALDGTGTKKLPAGKELWPYQKATLDYLLARKGGIDGDQPGLGKTPTAIAYCNEREAQRVLVIVPASVRLQWEERIKEWSTIPKVKVSTMLKSKDGIHPNAHYQIISYDAARNPAIIRAISKYQWDVLICDEAHKMKNMKAITTRAILGNSRGEYQHGEHKMKAVATHCREHLALTGTLLLNRPSECFAGSTLVLTDRGWLPIVQVRYTDKLWDGEGWVKHGGLLYQGCAKTVNVGRISATATHRFRVKCSWASADEVRLNSDLWKQALESGLENLPLNATHGIQAVSNMWSAFVTAADRQIQHCKNYAKALFSGADLARLLRARKKPIQNITQSALTLNYGSVCSPSLQVSGIEQKIPRTEPIAPMVVEGYVSGPNGGKIAPFFWRILWAYLVMKHRVCNWIASTRTKDTNRGIFDLFRVRKIWQIGVKFLTFNHDWIWHWKKSTCSVPVYDIANAGPRQRFTILSAEGPVIVHNCYVLFRHFDWEAINFASEDQFKERYNRQADMRTIEGKRFRLESTSLESELQNRLRVHVLARHEKKDVFQFMKPPRYSIVKCEADGKVSEALEAEGMLGLPIEEIQTTKDFEILGHIAEARRLMGVALAPQIVEYAKDFLEGSDEKLAIFGWHLDVLTIFEDGLSQFGTVRVDGSKSAVQRQKAVDDFVTKDNTRVFIGNIQAAGTGLDGLQKVCSRCYIAEPDWVPAQNEQAVSRLDRIGQENIVTAEIFVAPGSISEKILVKALEKMNVIHKVLDEKENKDG